MIGVTYDAGSKANLLPDEYHDAAASARALIEPARANRALRRNFESTPFNERVRPLDLGFLIPFR